MLKCSSSCVALAGSIVACAPKYPCFYAVSIQLTSFLIVLGSVFNHTQTSPDIMQTHCFVYFYIWHVEKKTEYRERTPSQSQRSLLTFPNCDHIPKQRFLGLKIFWKGLRRRLFQLFKGNFRLECWRNCFVRAFAPPLCWVLQEASDIWDLTAHIIFTLKVFWLFGFALNVGSVWGICKPSVHFEIVKFRSFNLQNVLLPL